MKKTLVISRWWGAGKIGAIEDDPADDILDLVGHEIEGRVDDVLYDLNEDNFLNVRGAILDEAGDGSDN